MDMSNTAISADKIRAYEATIHKIQINGAPITLWVGQYEPRLLGIYAAYEANCAALITAYNPWGEQQGQELNLADHQSLGDYLRSFSSNILTAEGAHPEGTWPPEPGYFVLGMSEDSAIAAGLQFRQDAVVWIGADAVPQLLLLR